MLSEEQYFQAKHFLKLYKDTLTCMEQVAKKKSQMAYTEKFYDKLKEGHLKKQIVFNTDGGLEKGEFLYSNYFYRMFDLLE